MPTSKMNVCELDGPLCGKVAAVMSSAAPRRDSHAGMLALVTLSRQHAAQSQPSSRSPSHVGTCGASSRS